MMHHHPFLHTEKEMVMTDAAQLMTKLKLNADLLMFGHRHQPKYYSSTSIPSIKYGAIAADSTRNASVAYEVEISPDGSNLSVNTVPIV